MGASREAFDWLGALGETHLETWISETARSVQQIAPGCVAMSVAVLDQEITLTLAADNLEAALLDAAQYLDGGPCVQALVEVETQTTHGPPTSESTWRLFAAAEAATGVASTLSLPVTDGEAVIGGINLYGSTLDTFDGLHEPLAAALGARAQDAITNADLGFTSRIRAAAAPERLRDRTDVDIASGIVATLLGTSGLEAKERMHHAAVRAGVADAEFARFIQDAHAVGLE